MSLRASGSGEAACLREGDYASLRWPTDSRILLLCFAFIGCCVLLGFHRFFQIITAICMGLMPSRLFLYYLHGFH